MTLSVVTVVEVLADVPSKWSPRGRVSGTRELVLAALPYSVAYRVSEGVVEVLRVLHTSRRWPRRL